MSLFSKITRLIFIRTISLSSWWGMIENQFKSSAIVIITIAIFLVYTLANLFLSINYTFLNLIRFRLWFIKNSILFYTYLQYPTSVFHSIPLKTEEDNTDSTIQLIAFNNTITDHNCLCCTSSISTLFVSWNVWKTSSTLQMLFKCFPMMKMSYK